MFAMVIVLALDLYDCAVQMWQWRTRLDKLPAQLRDKLDRFVQANVAGELFICICWLGAWIYICRAWSNNRTNYPHSLQLATKAWMVYFFAPFVLYIIAPLSYAFRSENLSRDICTMSLVSLMHLGPQFRAGFARGCTNEPKLGAIAYYPPPPLSSNVKDLKGWPGYKWCEANKYDWEARVFSTRWVRLSMMSLGVPDEEAVAKARTRENTHEGVVPSSLWQMSVIAAAGLDPEFIGCSKPHVLGDLLEGNHSHGSAQSSSSSWWTWLPDSQKLRELFTSMSGQGSADDLQLRATQSIIDATGTADHEGAAGTMRHKHLMRSQRALHGHQLLAVGSQGDLETSPSVNVTHDMGGAEAMIDAEGNVHLESALTSPVGRSVHRHTSVPTQEQDSASLIDTENGIPPKPHPAQPVCAAYASCLGLLRSAKMVKQSVHSFLGTYTTLLAIKTLFPATFAVINGIADSVQTVKEVIPTATSPGYMLLTGVVSFLPAFMHPVHFKRAPAE